MRSRLFPARNATGSMRYRGRHFLRVDRREAIGHRALEGGVLEGSRRVVGSGAGPSDHPLGGRLHAGVQGVRSTNRSRQLPLGM
jgi:hypothetical protein